MAKCNLGKVKIDPMLITGCVLWDNPKAHMTRCGVVTRVWRLPSLAWLLACVFANCLILLIVADH